MFNTNESSTSIPAFIAKLWEMVNDKKYDYLIQWCNDGTSFVIKDQNKFCSELLPIYYKHNNMASFIRQLNKYGFRKVVPIDSASLKNDRNDLEFAHAHFLRDYPALLWQIRRKISNTKEISYNNVVAQLAQHVQQIQQKHNILESKLVSMKNENNALWREHSLLRHKHQKLQKIVNKLIQFLVTLVQQTRGLNIKRRPAPLMIKDSSKLPIQSYTTIKSNPVSLINDINELESSSGENSTEIVVPDILDDSEEKCILSDFADYNILSQNKISEQSACPESSSSVVAVPLQEVSPAIVYGKYTNQVNDLQATEKKSREPVLISNLKKRKLNKKKLIEAPLQSALNKPVKIVIKPDIPSVNSYNKSVKLATLKPNINLSSNNLGNDSVISVQVLSPGSNAPQVSVQDAPQVSIQEAPQVSIQDAPIDMPEIVVLSSENIDDPNFLNDQSQFVIKDSGDVQQNIKNFDLKSESGDLTEVTSLPIILSPSGTELSPVHSVEEKSDNPLVLSDQNFSPVQKDIDTLQSDLDALKEMLQSEGFNLDASTILGLFNPEDPLSLNLPDPGIGSSSGSSSTGNELISYTSPNLVDIIDSFDDNEPSEYTEPLSLTSSTLNTPKPDLSIDYSGPPSKRKKK